MGARTAVGDVPGTGDTDLDLICTGELGRDKNGLAVDEHDNEAGEEDEGENISFIRGRFFIAMRIRILVLRLGLGRGLGLSRLIVGVNVLFDNGVAGGVFNSSSLAFRASSLPWRSFVPLPALRRSTPHRARKRARHTVLSLASVRHVRETLRHARRVASAVWAVSCSWGIV
jgi:hypothetical protein